MRHSCSSSRIYPCSGAAGLEICPLLFSLQQLRAHYVCPGAAAAPIMHPTALQSLPAVTKRDLRGERFPYRNTFTVSGLNIATVQAGSAVSLPCQWQEGLFICNLLYLHAGRNYFSQTGFNKRSFHKQLITSPAPWLPACQREPWQWAAGAACPPARAARYTGCPHGASRASARVQ